LPGETERQRLKISRWAITVLPDVILGCVLAIVQIASMVAHAARRSDACTGRSQKMKMLMGLTCVAKAAEKPAEKTANSIYDFTLKDIDGKDISLGSYTGKVVMVVNVASRCGFTSQYEGLEKLYQAYKERGFIILGFPANNFRGQELGTDAEIKSFCTLKYSVTFPMFSKISVKGRDKHALYKYLTDKQSNPDFAGEISWNFNKFLIGRDGKIINRFGSRTKPEDKALIQAIETALGK
jgi:glutathione peroxidase